MQVYLIITQKMNHCVVPSWDLEDNTSPPKFSGCAPSNSSNSLPSHVPSLDYEVAELTWENGQLAMHGLGGPPRVVNKSAAASSQWEKPRAGAGTLESIVSQATCQTEQKPAASSADLVSWFEHRRAMVNPASASPCITMTMDVDALVPCQRNNDKNNIQEKSSPPVTTGIGTCMVGSCSVAVAAKDGHGAARRGMCGCRNNASVSESATCGGRDSRQVTVDTAGERELGGAGFTSTSPWSAGNTSSGGGDYPKTSGDDHNYSVCHSRSQREAGGDVGKRKLGIEKSSVSTKRSRAAAVHNQSERKRRDKINQRMKTLQKLVPNCSKTDKASMLDEVIEYLKQLQAQVQMVSRMNMPPMMLPLALQQQLQMSMMGMGVMDINSIGRAATGMSPAATGMLPATSFMPMPSWDVPTERLSSPMVMPNDILSALLTCQSQQQQPMTMDAYSRLAALYQQFQQPPVSGSKN